LHQHTFYVASKTARAEQRRQKRENEAVQMNALDSENDWRHIAPMLDEAITQLGVEDRAAILLRFFEQRDFRAIGSAIGGSEDAARMRVNRALEKLHVILKRRGVALSAAALGTALASEAIKAAPLGLAAGIATTALAGVPTGGAALASTLKLLSMTKLHTGIISVLAAVVVTLPLAMQHHARVQLRQCDEMLRQQSDQLSQLNAETERLSNQLALAKSAQGLSKSEMNDLLRLRAQVGDLKKQLANAQAQSARQTTAPADQQASNSSPDQGGDEQKQLAIAKMNNARQWLLTFILYAGDHQGQFPHDFEHALSGLSRDPGLSQDAKDGMLQATNNFEMVYQGSVNAITNASQTIVLREIQPAPAGTGWTKTYGFADGHVEIHRFADSNFQDWESQHMVAPSQ
jgi:hypothetical protein